MSEYPSYLIHYGIEGQKWGVRRFQNEDGTYTSEGLERRKKLIEQGAPRKEIRQATKEGKRELRYNKQLRKKQEKIGRKFDRKTERILSKISGSDFDGYSSGVSKRSYNKAVKLGTEFRVADYIAKDPKMYYEIKKADEQARNSQVLALGTTVLGALTIGLGAGKFSTINVKKAMKDAYVYAYEQARNETIADLEKHGIKRRT